MSSSIMTAFRPRNATSPRPVVTLEKYARSFEGAGVPVVAGSGGAYWLSSRERVVRRLPTFQLGAPSDEEVDRVLRGTGAVLATYNVQPDEQHAANAWLYVCSDAQYSLRDRLPAMQRNVRRAMRELRVAPISPRELLAYGEAAFCDTRRRTGLNDGTARGFQRYFRDTIDQPGRAYLGAWKDGRLAAFLTIARVDDWAEIGSFSMTSMLGYRPNDALMYIALSTYLADGACRVVCYGLSSIQSRSNAAGLHRFKRKVGFHALGVHRAFVLHSSLRPFANHVTLAAARWAAERLLTVRPRSRNLKRLEGMLAMLAPPEGRHDQASHFLRFVRP